MGEYERVLYSCHPVYGSFRIKGQNIMQYITQYSRNVDDIYIQSTDEQQAKTCHHIMNKKHSHADQIWNWNIYYIHYSLLLLDSS